MLYNAWFKADWDLDRNIENRWWSRWRHRNRWGWAIQPNAFGLPSITSSHLLLWRGTTKINYRAGLHSSAHQEWGQPASTLVFECLKVADEETDMGTRDPSTEGVCASWYRSCRCEVVRCSVSYTGQYQAMVNIPSQCTLCERPQDSQHHPKHFFSTLKTMGQRFPRSLEMSHFFQGIPNDMNLCFLHLLPLTLLGIECLLHESNGGHMTDMACPT